MTEHASTRKAAAVAAEIQRPASERHANAMHAAKHQHYLSLWIRYEHEMCTKLWRRLRQCTAPTHDSNHAPKSALAGSHSLFQLIFSSAPMTKWVQSKCIERVTQHKPSRDLQILNWFGALCHFPARHFPYRDSLSKGVFASPSSILYWFLCRLIDSSWSECEVTPWSLFMS